MGHPRKAKCKFASRSTQLCPATSSAPSSCAHRPLCCWGQLGGCCPEALGVALGAFQSALVQAASRRLTRDVAPSQGQACLATLGHHEQPQGAFQDNHQITVCPQQEKLLLLHRVARLGLLFGLLFCFSSFLSFFCPFFLVVLFPPTLTEKKTQQTYANKDEHHRKPVSHFRPQSTLTKGHCSFMTFSAEALGGSGYFLSLYSLSLFSHPLRLLRLSPKNYLNNIIY